MPTNHTTVTIENLMSHSRWLRALAARLVGNGDAEDLVQQTWQAALESGPRHSGNLRGWLQRVARRLAGASHKSRSRRVRRELAVAALRDADERGPTTAELVEQADLHRHLVHLVTQLTEPNRTTLLLHFVRGMPLATIAKRQRVPASTVRNRLRRALEELRRKLDAHHDGDRDAWLSALAPLAPCGATRTTPTDPAGDPIAPTTFTRPWAIAAGVLPLIAVATWIGSRPFVAEENPEHIARAAQGDPTDTGSGGPNGASQPHSLPAADIPRSRVPATPAPATAPDDAARVDELPDWGLVVDVSGHPVESVDLSWSPASAAPDENGEGSRRIAGDDVVGTSDRDGAFRWQRPSEPGTLAVETADWTTVLYAEIRDGEQNHPPTVVVARRAMLRGRVVDNEGNAIERAAVHLELPPRVRAGVGLVLENSQEATRSVATNATGAFELAAPLLAGVTVSCRALGHSEWRGSVQEASRITLHPHASAESARSLTGVVLDPDGYPVADARVVHDGRDTSSRADGSFRIPVDHDADLDGGTRRVVAIHRELGAAYGSIEALTPSPHVVLQFAHRTELVGRVRTARGDPVPNALVRMMPTGKVLGATHRGHVVQPGERQRVATGPSIQLPQITTDSEGTFRVLAPPLPELRLTALHPHSLATASRVVEVRGETVSIELTLAAKGDRRLTGRIVDQWGRPLAGALVEARRSTSTSALPGLSLGLGRVRTTSSVNGAFEFDGLVTADMRLHVSARDALPTSIRIGTNDRFDGDSDIRLQLAAHVRIEATGVRCDAATYFDSDGNPLGTATFAGRSVTTNRHRIPLFDGRSTVHRAPLHAASIALLVREHDQAPHVEVRRIPVALRTGRLNVVRF